MAKWKEEVFVDHLVNIASSKLIYVFDQRVNLLNGPVMLAQLVWLLVPIPKINNHLTTSFSLAMEAAVFFSMSHRAFGSFVIVGVRKVSKL